MLGVSWCKFLQEAVGWDKNIFSTIGAFFRVFFTIALVLIFIGVFLLVLRGLLDLAEPTALFLQVSTLTHVSRFT